MEEDVGGSDELVGTKNTEVLYEAHGAGAAVEGQPNKVYHFGHQRWGHVHGPRTKLPNVVSVYSFGFVIGIMIKFQTRGRWWSGDPFRI